MRVNETEMTLENEFNINQYPILDVDCVEEFKSEDNGVEIDGVHDSVLDGILENKVPSGNFDPTMNKFHEWDVMQVTKDWRTTKPTDSSFGNSLCTSACKPKSEKTLFFPVKIHRKVVDYPNFQNGFSR